MLTQTLQHEPKNPVFQHGLKRREMEKEKAAADMMEEVRGMEKGEGKVQRAVNRLHATDVRW